MNLINELNDSVNIGRLLQCVEAVDGLPRHLVRELAFLDIYLEVQVVIRICPKIAKVSERPPDLIGLAVSASGQIVDQPPMIPATVFKDDPF